MAGTKGNQNAVGNSGGKSLQDRERAARVRSLALAEIESVLNGSKKTYLYKAILIKLAGSVLPRLTEVSGPDGDALQIGVVMLPPKNASPLDTTTQTGDSTRQT